MKKHSLFLLSLASAMLIFAGAQMSKRADTYVETYNVGLRQQSAFKASLKAAISPEPKGAKKKLPTKEEFDAILETFDRVNQLYLESRDNPEPWWRRQFFPQPDRRIAALSMFHKANLLALVKDVKSADEAYKAAAQLNPGNDFDVAEWGTLDIVMLQQLAREGTTRCHNHELLLNQNKEQGEGQGKGKGGKSKGKKKGKGNGKGKGKEKSEQQGPGKKPGRGAQPGSSPRRPL